MAATWFEIPQWEGLYSISSEFEIKNDRTGRVKKTTISKVGYPVVQLWASNKGTVLYIHDIVAQVFIGPRPEGLVINHKDGIKTNNDPLNLEYVPQRYNILHALGTGLYNPGEHAKKLTSEQVIEIRQKLLEGERNCDLAQEYSISNTTISEIKHGKKRRFKNEQITTS